MAIKPCICRRRGQWAVRVMPAVTSYFPTFDEACDYAKMVRVA